MGRVSPLFPAIVVACVVGSACAQTVIEATVTFAADRSIYLDVGASHGVRQGCVVTITEQAGGVRHAVVVDVSENSCRAEVEFDAQAPPAGTLVTIDLPADQGEGQREGQDGEQEGGENEPLRPEVRVVPPHAPWTGTTEGEGSEDVLLAPTRRTLAHQREAETRGRVYSQFRYSRDTGGREANDYSFARLGAKFEMTNPFGKGGRLLFRGDLDRRSSGLFGDENAAWDARLQQFSYAIGGHEYSQYRAEFGRFYSAYVPEVGLTDGVEAAVRLDESWSVGAGVGMFTTQQFDENLGEDYGFYLFADYKPAVESPLQGTMAYQQTWNKGSLDQQQLIGRVFAKPAETVSIYALAQADVYTSDDTVKGSGVELTRGTVVVRFTPDLTKGASAGYTHNRYPEIKRQDFDLFPDDLLRDGQLDRVFLSGWARVTDSVRLDANISHWSDQDRDGTSGRAGARWTDLWNESASALGSVYFNQGAFGDGVGARVQLDERLGQVDVDLEYDIYRYTSTGMAVGDYTTTRHTVRAGAGWGEGRWRYNVDLGYMFGDSDDSIAFRTYIEYRF